MYNDFENDFWKNKVRLMLYENMKRGEQTRLDLKSFENEILKFRKENPGLKDEYAVESSYISWVIELSQKHYIQLLFQNMTKFTFAEKTKNGNIKICDAKFFNSPFYDINVFVKNYDSYVLELNSGCFDYAKSLAAKKLAFEFAKAMLKKKYDSCDFIWDLKMQENDFLLTFTKKSESKNYNISVSDFKNEIAGLLNNLF